MIGWNDRQTMKVKVRHLRCMLRRQVVSVRIKANKGGRRVREIKETGINAAKDAILPRLPGVSKLALESPVPYLLRSNDPPGEDDIARARDVVASVEREEERMKKKLFLRSRGRGFGYWTTVTKHKLQQTSDFIQQHRGVISPLRALPHEILQEIFFRVVEPKPQGHWMNVGEIPWKVGQVCRSWRKSALAVSALWSRLPTVDLHDSDHLSQMKLQVEYLKELLHRSRSAPLEIYFFCLGFKGVTHPVIDLLIDHSERWKIATVKIDVSMLPCLSKIRGRLPHLETLSLYLSGYGPVIDTVDIFDDAPQLRQVDIGGPFLADIALPFQQLAHYKDRMRMRNSITRVVTAANSLEALTILELCETSGTPHIPLATLPSLHTLQVKFCCTRPDFLNNLILPAIEEIQMVSYNDRGGLLTTLANIVSKSPSPCPLKTLRFRSHTVEVGQLPAFLQLTPNLTHLNMPLPFGSDIEALVSQSIVPLLETCEFFIQDLSYTSHDFERAEALNKLAASRCERVVETKFSVNRQGVAPTPRRLKDLQLHFDRSRWVPKQKILLEGWETRLEGCASTPLPEYLRALRLALLEEIPLLANVPFIRLKKFTKKREKSVYDILNLVEAFDPIDAAEVYVSFVLSQKRNNKIESIRSLKFIFLSRI